MAGRSFTSGDGYRYGFNGMERDNELKGSGNSYDFGARILDPRLGRWLSLDPLAQKYPYASPYNFVLNNPMVFVDPDGREVVWNNYLKKNLGSSFINTLSANSIYKQVFKNFLANQDNHFFNEKILSGGNLGHGASASIARGGGIGANGFVTSIQKEYFQNGYLIADETFLAMVILHEGIHQKKNLRISTDGISNYPGYDDHYNNPYHKSKQKQSDLHHNQMASFNRGLLVDGMKEFDKDMGTSHTEDWYQAMSWIGLRRTESWADFENKNPTKAKVYSDLINEEIIDMEINRVNAKMKKKKGP